MSPRSSAQLACPLQQRAAPHDQSRSISSSGQLPSRSASRGCSPSHPNSRVDAITTSRSPHAVIRARTAADICMYVISLTPECAVRDAPPAVRPARSRSTTRACRATVARRQWRGMRLCSARRWRTHLDTTSTTGGSPDKFFCLRADMVPVVR